MLGDHVQYVLAGHSIVLARVTCSSSSHLSCEAHLSGVTKACGHYLPDRSKCFSSNKQSQSCSSDNPLGQMKDIIAAHLIRPAAPMTGHSLHRERDSSQGHIAGFGDSPILCTFARPAVDVILHCAWHFTVVELSGVWSVGEHGLGDATVAVNSWGDSDAMVSLRKGRAPLHWTS